MQERQLQVGEGGGGAEGGGREEEGEGWFDCW